VPVRLDGSLGRAEGKGDLLVELSAHDQVEDQSGGREVTQDFMRLFLLPGVYHCSGGPGEDTVDWLTQIQKWVEQEQAPATVTASKVARDGTVTSTRVVPEYVPSS